MQISISINAKRQAFAIEEPIIVTENNDTVVAFGFMEGCGFTEDEKIAVFITQRGKQEVTFTGLSCSAPLFCAEDGGSVQIGLTQGTIKTTTPAYVRLVRSVLAQSGAVAPPLPDADDTVSSIDSSDLIRVNSVSLGKWVKATIATLAARIKALIGVFTPSAAGLVPAPGAGTPQGYVLRADRSWGPGSGGSVEIDQSPEEGSANAVASGGVYAALQGKLDTNGNANGATVQRSGTYFFADIPAGRITIQELAGRIAGWYSTVAKNRLMYISAGTGIVVSDTIDPETGNALREISVDPDDIVTEDGANAVTGKAVYEAIQAAISGLPVYDGTVI